MRVSIGVDLHKAQFTVYRLVNGGRGRHGRFTTEPSGMGRFIRMLRKYQNRDAKVTLAVESTGNTRYFKTEMERTGVTVRVVNPKRFKVVCESANKTDYRDAKILAEFLDKDFIPEVRLCSDESQRLRRLVTSREILVRSAVKLKNQLHGIFLEKGIQTRAGQFNTRKGLREALTLVNETERMVVTPIVEAIESFRDQAKAISETLKTLTEKDKVVEVLKTIPGTGDLNATVVRAFMDDVKRFETGDRFAAYAGLVPRVQVSDETVHIGHVTKQGPKELRTALIQMVLGMIRCKDQAQNALMVSYRNLKAKKGSGRALVAMARRLSTIVWTMVKRNDSFDLGKLNQKARHQETKKAYKLQGV